MRGREKEPLSLLELLGESTKVFGLLADDREERKMGVL